VYLSVSRGRGPDAAPVLFRVDASGKISEVSLTNVKFAKAELPDAPENRETGEGRRRGNQRLQSITDMAYVDGRLFVAGLSNEEFESKLRSIPFPFTPADAGATVEIYHGSHGRYETQAPVRTFTHYNIAGEPHILAAFTCTPLVKFPVSQLVPGSKLRGTTLAELGNRNTPLDMFIYSKDGKDYVLMANDRRGVMKISTDDLGRSEGITERVPDKAGQEFTTIEELKNVVHLDRLNEENAVVLVQDQDGNSKLQTIALP
jgi:hypothetical protein